MKVNELMVGDWVQVPSELNRYKRIRSTFDMDSAVLYKPIPLTPEILEKSGFRLNPQGSYSIGRNVSIDILDGHYNANINTDNPQAPSFLYLVGSYVHELQHALRLCGIEKEIIL